MAETLKVASYNLQNGNRPDVLGQSLRTMEADGVQVFCLQELWNHSIADSVQGNLGGDWRKEVYVQDSPGTDLGVGILWRGDELSMKEVKRITLPRLETQDWWGKRLSRNTRTPQRGAIIADFVAGGQEVRITNAHLDWQGGMRQRIRQLSALTEYLSTLPESPYEIICGDFNTVFLSGLRDAGRHQLENVLGPQFQDALPQVKSTWNMESLDPVEKSTTILSKVRRLNMRIPQRMDYIFIKGFKVVDSKVERLDGSNHFPITATLSFNNVAA